MRTDVVLDLARWARSPDEVDRRVLRQCSGPTLDVGCGPGRMVLALSRRGVPALGIDVAPEAVRQVRAAGGLALARSVFGHLPGEGRWAAALALDGCIGIGGSPDLLLGRIAELLAPGGTAYVEHDPDPHRCDRVIARVLLPSGHHGTPFAWALVGLHAVARAAAGAGLVPTGTWTASGRSFTACRRAEP